MDKCVNIKIFVVRWHAIEF